MDISVIQEKERKLDNCTNTLKKEFVGIDNVIDQVMGNIKSWYIFPDLNERPIVINLWGMTGCGKTSLVMRICELLELNENIVYYNLAKLGEETSEEMEDEFDTVIGTASKNNVFIFDEFQFAASIASDGKEKEPKTSLKTIWEIIDAGKIHRDIPKYLKRNLKRLLQTLNWLDIYGAEIKDGVFVNSEEFFNKMSVEQKSEIVSYYNMSHELPETYLELKPTRYWCNIADANIINDKSYYLSCDFVGPIYDVVHMMENSEISHSEFISNVLKPMSHDQLCDYIMNLLKKLGNGYYRDYSKSLIFVMGNIDEAYKISYDMDPDMDPDQFHAMTEKLTVIDIREALQERFRNEQIARLGSIMILYPSFSKQNFKDIISLQLDNYAKNVKEKMGFDISFDESINDLIYKDGVIPAQGTRPVFASIYEIVRSKLAPIVIESINNKYYDISSIRLYAENDLVKAEVVSAQNTFTTEFKQVLRIDNLRNNVKKEQQQLTAVHESGHFVIYSKLTGNIPAKLVSATASTTANGFMMPDTEDRETYMTYADCLNDIRISLAGYAAELLVFGSDNLTSGACEDLRKATVMASRMIRDYGMGEDPDIAVSTYLCDNLSTEGGSIICDTERERDSINLKVRTVLDDCVDNVIRTLSKEPWKEMFKQSCAYLRTNMVMPKEKMEEIYKSVDEKVRTECARKKDIFEKALDEFLNN